MTELQHYYEFNFAQLLKQLLAVSHLKSYVLANYLNYDVSYISKWVTGSMLPAAKHSRATCQKIAAFISDNSDAAAQQELFSIFQVNTKDELEHSLFDAFCDAYQRSSEKDSSVDGGATRISADNSYTVANPRLQKMYIKFQQTQNRPNDRKDNLALMTDLFSLAREDKLGIATADDGTGFIHTIDEIHYLVSLNKNLVDDAFDGLLITYMMNSYADFNFKISHYSHMPCSLLFAVQNQTMYLSLISQNHRAIMSDTCNNKNIANEMYDTIIATEHAFAKPLFHNSSVRNLVKDKQYLSFIISSNISLYIDRIDEFLLPDDVFEELLVQCGSRISSADAAELRNLHMMFSSALNYSNVKIAILDRCLQEYAIDGRLDFYGIETELSVDQRRRHLEYILSLISRGIPTLKVQLVSSSSMKSFNQKFNPCIYLSDCISYLRIRGGTQKDDARIMDTPELLDVYQRFMNTIFDRDGTDSAASVLQLSAYLNMLNMMKG